MNDLIKKTLEKIEQEHITPEPRWKFLARKFFRWSLAGVFIVLGALAVSAGYFLLGQLDWDLYQTMHANRFVYAFSLLPYPWLALLAIFLAVAFLGVRRTENGYRFSWIKITFIIFVGLLSLGLFFSLFGLGGPVSHMTSGYAPYFMQHMATKETQWMQPERGLLAGTILVMEKNQFRLQDLNGKEWLVILNEKTIVRPTVDFSVEQIVKIIGTQKDQETFEAAEIRPWVGRGMMQSGMGRGMMREN